MTAASSDGSFVSKRFAAAPLRSRLTSFFIVGALLLLVVVAVNSIAFTGLISSRHTLSNNLDPANLQADALFLAYLNEETGVRGYVLSGNPVFLQPYDLGRAQAARSSHQLDDLLADQPPLLELALRAQDQADRWLNNYVKPAIASIRAHRSTAGSQAALLRSKSLFDAVRAGFSNLDAALAAKRAAAQEGLASSTATLVGTLAASLVVILLAIIIVTRSLRNWVTGPLSSIGADSRAVASGDIHHRISPTGPPDLWQHAEDLEAMRQRIVSELEAAQSSQSELAIVNAELERSNKELEQFAYVASHDLQEPLRKVTSFVQLLKERYEGELDDRADQYIGFAVDGSKRMQRLINDLLSFSRVGRTTERFVDVDLAATALAALANLNSSIEETGATVRVGPLPVVNGDESLLVSLWQNLVGNALKFRSEQSPVVEIQALQTDEMWLCTVTDNGIGIEPRFAERIFVLFQRLHSRDSYPGTGIGLALSKKIVEFHGGRIWLDQEHQPGTKMCFTLPVRTEVNNEHGDSS